MEKRDEVHKEIPVKRRVQQICGYFLYPDKSYLQKTDIKDREMFGWKYQRAREKKSKSLQRYSQAAHPTLE